MNKVFNKLIKIIKIVSANLIILVLCLVLTIFTVELFHRYKYLIKLPPDDTLTVTFGHKVKNNRFGYRERDFSYQFLKQQDFIVVVLGDSLTWGVGLSESQRYSNLLERYLKSEYPDKKIAVLNYAIDSGATTEERDILRLIYKEIKPNLIIVGFCLNDPQEKPQNYSVEREYYFSKIEPLLSFFNKKRMNGTTRLISRVYENILTSTKKIPTWLDALDRVYRKDSLAWHRFETALRDINSMAKEVSSNPPIFISLNQGVSNSMPTDYAKPDGILENYFMRWYHQAESTARNQGFIAINCEEEFSVKLRKHVMAVIPGGDGHPSAEMNEIYAQKLLSVIQKDKLFK
ncbi:MAG: SGNH/GDSL hydrolase family protein [Candidatus Omnitrophica bacterium]|nr:SGNH/GDSL hydrolase family protein [Candidatus Omnitrophota bacterium]